MSNAIQESAQSALVDLVYQRTPNLLIAQLIAILFVFSASEYENAHILNTWLAVVMLCICIWCGAYVLYCGNNSTMSFAEKKRWKLTWLLIAFSTASLQSFALIIFTPVDQPAFLLSSGMFALCLISVGVIALSASFYAVVSYCLPILAPFTIYSSLYGDEIGLLLTSVIAIFCFSVGSIVRANNKAYKDMIKLKTESQFVIEERKKIQQEQQELTRRDGLTGLFNRRYFFEIMEQEIGRAYRNHTPLSLLLIDIDHFKEYNEHYGYIEGDNRLREIANLLESLLNRKGDLLARYDGGQFACILPNIDSKGAVSYAEKLQIFIQEKRIEHRASKLTFLKSVTISIGATSLPTLAKLSTVELIQHAESALFQAKTQGRNRVKFYESIDFDQDRV